MLLSVRNLSKSYGDRAVLRGVSLDVDRGDVVALLGASGSGKTTLLRCLDFLERADAGTIAFEGEPPVDLSRRVRGADMVRLRRRTAFVFQNYNLFLNKTALQNITEGLVVARGMPRDSAIAAAHAALERVGLADRADAYPSQLSGGQQQRVGIARAIAADPAVIFLDEPTSALDPRLVDGVLDLLRDLAAEGRTMILATHQLGFAREVATKAVFLDNGVVAEAAPAREFFTAPREARTRAFLTAEPDSNRERA